MANKLESENRELRQANEILKKASAYFAMVRKAVRPCFSTACSGSTARFASDRFRFADLRFIDEHRGQFGVEPMCKMLQIARSTYYERRAIARDPERASPRAKSDADICIKIDAAGKDNRSQAQGYMTQATALSERAEGTH